MTKVINKVVEELTSEFAEVRKLTDDLFKTLSIEDAINFTFLYKLLLVYIIDIIAFIVCYLGEQFRRVNFFLLIVKIS